MPCHSRAAVPCSPHTLPHARSSVKFRSSALLLPLHRAAAAPGPARLPVPAAVVALPPAQARNKRMQRTPSLRVTSVRPLYGCIVSHDYSARFVKSRGTCGVLSLVWWLLFRWLSDCLALPQARFRTAIQLHACRKEWPPPCWAHIGILLPRYLIAGPMQPRP